MDQTHDDTDNTPRKTPFHQLALAWGGIILSGALAIGALLDAISNAISVVTPLFTYIATTVIVFGWIAVSVWLRFHPISWVEKGTVIRISRLGTKNSLSMLGVLGVLWLPRILSNENEVTESPKVSNTNPFVRIDAIDLLGSEPGEFPYADKLLHSFVLHGKDETAGPRKNFGLLMFYKHLDSGDQSVGWFVVSKLDTHGFAIPNWIRLDELDSRGWDFHTSRLYLNKDARVSLAFRAVVLPSDFISKHEREIVDDQIGWGRKSLAEFTDRTNSISSPQFDFTK